MDQDGVWMVVLSVTICLTFTFTLGACLCCRRKVHKNDLLGLEGRMVTVSPDDSSGSGNALTNGSGDASGDHHHHKANGVDQTDHQHHHENEKRASGATHRSLPDIPTVDDIEAVRGGSNERGIGTDGPGGNGQAGDTNSDLYATVGDKVVVQQRVMPGHVLDHGKQASISQHSSLSQADDISSPYASVRSPPHAYDKIRKAEHPYAQLQPTAANAIAETNSNNSRRASSESLLGSDVENPGTRQAEIPAASAIAGRVSASQELPYMTPPIVQSQPPAQQPSSLLPSNAPPPQQHFSGDSQDSSKGYTSISVREPLANILAQTKSAQQSLQQRKLARQFQDSHYATVSDDSDEMYAAIEDPNGPPGELYTSGSETYAQIQPMVVNVEVNSPQIPVAPGLAMERSSSPSVLQSTLMTTSTTSSTMEAPPTALPALSMPPPPPPVTVAVAVGAQHSRQASSSSSIGGILGSPKPEKRQANSPLPPTPKSNAGKVAGQYLSNTTLNSGRNSVASAYNVDFSPSRKDGGGAEGGKELLADGAAGGKKKSPSKDLEGMYAKVMKKNKLSSAPSENASPIFGRRVLAGEGDVGELSTGSSSREGSAEKASGSVLVEQNNYETIERKAVVMKRSARDPGYETIPGEKCRRDLLDSLNATQGMGVEGVGKSRNSAPAGVLADGIHRVSQNSLDIIKGGVVSKEGLVIAAVDEPLSLLSNDDPGYETVRQVGGAPVRKLSANESNSEHDPNYETLLPNATVTSQVKPRPQSRRFGDDEEDDGYSKIRPGGVAHSQTPVVVIKKATTTSSCTDNEGYSSIRNVDATEEEDEPGYSQIGTATKLSGVHGYASIDETKKDQLEGYSTITAVPTSTTSATTNNSSVSPISPIAYFPAPSADTSYSSATSPSSESDVNVNRNSGNNYESLTSDDPNYETVPHLRITENPYEVLENELSTPGAVVGETVEDKREDVDGDDDFVVTTVKGAEKRDRGKVSPSDSPEVGDYFQV